MQSANSIGRPLSSNIQYIPGTNKLDDSQREDIILPSNIYTRGKWATRKYIDAWTKYTKKGFKGDKNSNFYEFLAMGLVPYTIGSAVIIATFNYINHMLPVSDGRNASRIGLKAGLGVIFFGLAKHFSKKLVQKPVEWATGIDVDLPYRKYSQELPTLKDNTPYSYEGHQAFESIEFPRTDKMPYYGEGPESVNKMFDKIARKLGYTQELTDSDQIVKPKIREIVTKTKTTTYITQYMWATLGIALACQNAWEKLIDCQCVSPIFDTNPRILFSNLLSKAKELTSLEHIKLVGKTFKDAAKELYHGGVLPNKADHISGKALIATTFLSTILGTAWIIMSSKRKDNPIPNKYKIDQTKDYSVS